MSRRAFVAAACAALLAGCAVQPTYERPPVELPAAWRPSEEGGRVAAAAADVFDARWWRIYRDPALEKLVEEALAQNTDLLVAAARVDEARSLLGEAEAALLPGVDATLRRDRTSYSEVQAFPIPPGIPRDRNNTRATLNVSYEIDMWGRLRTAAQAARAELLAGEAARNTVRIALSAQVAKSYFALRALDAQLAVTRRALALRESSLRLQRKRFDGGDLSAYDLRQIEAEAAAVRAQLPPLERDREVEEAALGVLLGRSPKAVLAGTAVGGTAVESAVQSERRSGDVDGPLLAPVVPAGLPSELLLRRPDLVEAEQRLAAANARVAVARSALFPSIALTGFLGSESAGLSNLFTGPAGIWQVAAAAAQPIFAGGRLQAQVGAAEARERAALAQYQRAIQNAFREVREALAGQTRARRSFEAESERVEVLRATLRLARLRHEHGLASQFEAIDAERNLLVAESARIEALRAQRAAVADLFRALGVAAR